MAPKESLAYDYRYWDYKGNTALPLELPQQPYERSPQRKVKKKSAAQVKVNAGNRTKSSMSTMMFSMVFCFGIAILLIVRSAYIAEMNFNLNRIDEEYQVAMKTNKELNVRLLKSVNLETLEQTAFNQLKMKYPDVQKGISYVSVDPTKIIDNKDYRGYYNIANVQEKQLVDRVKEYAGSLAGILKFR